MGAIFSRLGSLYDSLVSDEPMRILMLGLDAAGKTTIMYKFKLNEVVSTIPTIGFNVETVTPKKGLTFTMWDVGGQTKLRPLWAHYYVGTQGLIYVVDSNDRERFEESRQELFAILDADAMRGVPVVVLANKQDLPNAVDCSKIAEVLHLDKLRDRKWHVQGCCATSGEGLYEGMDQLGTLAKQFRRQQR